MVDIRHRVGIEAPQAQVYEKLATREGLSEWWTRDVRGESQVGEELQFFFGRPEPSAVMEVSALDPVDRVAWRCVGGPDEWLGTELTFDLTSADGETVVLFTHAGWCEPVEFMHHCSTKWAYFLLGLKTLLEAGVGTPFPGEVKISRWG